MHFNLKNVSIIAVCALILYGVLALAFGVYKAYAPSVVTPVPTETVVTKNPHDGTYIIGGQKITLTNGLSEIKAAPGSAAKIITRYFGSDVAADFDLDGRQDLAFIVSQDAGGSGMFYYVVALLNTKNGSAGTQAVLLGDRIAPQTLELKGKNTLIANFAERKAGESFAVPPSVARSLYLRLNAKTGIFDDVTSKQ